MTGELRVWWIRNPPNEPNYYPVKTIKGAKAKILLLEATDDIGTKVLNNLGGLHIKNKRGGWDEWRDETHGDIWEAIKEDE